MHNDLEKLAHVLGPDLATYDPYDLWKTKLGIWLRRIYYKRGKIAIPLVAPLFLLDTYCPKTVRAFIAPQEYPIVRALAALSALHFYELSADVKYLDTASCSIRWLTENQSPGYYGACWGLNFPWENRRGHYTASTPYITHTPYCVEALLKFFDVTGDEEVRKVALSSLAFLEKDLRVLIDEPDILALSYGPTHETIPVINANSYAMMLYALLAQRCIKERAVLLRKASRLCRFVTSRQNTDGSWFYYDGKGKGNFIDCFHTCFVLTNLHKYGALTGYDVENVIERGLGYLTKNFIDDKTFLARRFTLAANPSLTKYDLYDQAELLTLLVLTGKSEMAEKSYKALMKNFYLPEKQNFAYQIDVFGLVNKMTYLRWAIMPAIYALSLYHTHLTSSRRPPGDLDLRKTDGMTASKQRSQSCAESPG